MIDERIELAIKQFIVALKDQGIPRDQFHLEVSHEAGRILNNLMDAPAVLLGGELAPNKINICGLEVKVDAPGNDSDDWEAKFLWQRVVNAS